MAYLEAENDYTADRTANSASLGEAVYQEIKSRTADTDQSVPTRKGDWWYYTRIQKGQQRPLHCRCPVAPGKGHPQPTEDGRSIPGEQILLDENELAGSSETFTIGALEISPSGRYLAYSVDHRGDERFTLKFKDLETNTEFQDAIPNTFYGAAWSTESSVVFYITRDTSWRPHRIWRHRVGAPAGDDVMVYEEPDQRFWLNVYLSLSERFVMIETSTPTTGEIHLIEADKPELAPRLAVHRREGVEYSLVDCGDWFFIMHNDRAPNFCLARAPVAEPEKWTTIIPCREDIRFLSINAFEGHLLVHYRRDGLSRLAVMEVGRDGSIGEWREIQFDEPLYQVRPGGNPEYRARSFRLEYESFVTPTSVYDYDSTADELVLRWREQVRGGYDSSRYLQQREWATAPDGTKVPISLVFRRDIPRDGSAPCLLYGYGSYELSIDPFFSIPRLSLLDRGFILAVAHARGGGELGRQWYEQGRRGNKWNTFSDFVACARHLATAGWTLPSRLVARGASAGGLVIGVMANEAPGVFGALVAESPFVDPLGALLDSSSPMTFSDWDEFGNPLADPDSYAYIRSYAPYENVGSHVYPPILVVSKLEDSRVPYHDPARWVARLRSRNLGAPDILLRTLTESGHFGRTGRYDEWREQAFIIAWIINAVGASYERTGNGS
jgi:oligopeptidase B